MEEGELVKEFLGNMPTARFIAMYVFAFMGMLLFFLSDVRKAIKYDPTTAKVFNWKDFFTKGALRIASNLIFLAVGVLFWDKMSVLLFNAQEPLVLDGLAAFIFGTMSDMYVEKFLGLTKNGK